MRDRASDLRAIADGRLMLNVRNGVTVSRSMLAMIADEIDALRAAPLAPAEVGGLVERLLRADLDAVQQAASLIQSQAARIAELEAVLARVPGALNGAFMAGSEEREGGSARRQERYAAEADVLRVEIPALLKGERKG